jgi:hypothetical protein
MLYVCIIVINKIKIMKVSDLKLGQKFVSKTKVNEVVEITTLDTQSLFTELAFTVLTDSDENYLEDDKGEVLFPLYSFLNYYKAV